MRQEELWYEWWLARIRQISTTRKKRLRELFGNAKSIYDAVYNIEETPIMLKNQITKEEHIILEKEVKNSSLEKEYERICSSGIKFIPYFSPDYPKRLMTLPGMPYALYVKGELPSDEVPSVAIVGARRCTPYGEAKAIEYAEALAGNGVQIISGMARGIDGIAQRAAIGAGGKTYAVLGSGVDVCYPKENRGLYQDLPKYGGILSEQQPGSPPLREFFPARNRIISGLADVILVIEAKKKSGSLISADFALEQGKDVYALPGPVDSELSRGCHELIRQGAGILISPELLLEDMEMIPSVRKKNTKTKKMKNEKVLESDENIVYAFVGLFPKTLHQIIEESGLRAEIVMRILVSLEFKGYIKEISKNHYIRI